jgi:hypothetical protein
MVPLESIFGAPRGTGTSVLEPLVDTLSREYLLLAIISRFVTVV